MVHCTKTDTSRQQLHAAMMMMMMLHACMHADRTGDETGSGGQIRSRQQSHPAVHSADIQVLRRSVQRHL